MKNKILPAVFLPLRSLAFFLIFITGSLSLKKDLSEINNWWSIAASIMNIIIILLLIIITKKTGSDFGKLINYEKGKTKVREIFLTLLIIFSVGMIGMYLAGFICYGLIPYSPPAMIAPLPPVLAVCNFFILPVSTAFAEEGVYLGCGVNQIKNKYAAIFIPAFFFALQHSFIPTLLDVKFIIYRFLSFLPLTIILCCQYYKKRNPLSIMIGHALLDFATVSMILATSLIPGLYETMCSL